MKSKTHHFFERDERIVSTINIQKSIKELKKMSNVIRCYKMLINKYKKALLEIEFFERKTMLLEKQIALLTKSNGKYPGKRTFYSFKRYEGNKNQIQKKD